MLMKLHVLITMIRVAYRSGEVTPRAGRLVGYSKVSVIIKTNNKNTVPYGVIKIT